MIYDLKQKYNIPKDCKEIIKLAKVSFYDFKEFLVNMAGVGTNEG